MRNVDNFDLDQWVNDYEKNNSGNVESFLLESNSSTIWKEQTNDGRFDDDLTIELEQYL